MLFKQAEQEDSAHARPSSRVIVNQIPICVNLKSCRSHKWLPLAALLNDAK